MLLLRWRWWRCIDEGWWWRWSERRYFRNYWWNLIQFKRNLISLPIFGLRQKVHNCFHDYCQRQSFQAWIIPHINAQNNSILFSIFTQPSKIFFRFFLEIFVVYASRRRRRWMKLKCMLSFLEQQKDVLVPFRRQIVKGAICRFETLSKKDYLISISCVLNLEWVIYWRANETHRAMPQLFFLNFFGWGKFSRQR